MVSPSSKTARVGYINSTPRVFVMQCNAAKYVVWLVLQNANSLFVATMSEVMGKMVISNK